LSEIGCEKFPDHTRNFLEFSIHRRKQFFFVLAKYRTPLFLRLQIDEILCVEKSRRVRAIVGPSHLAPALRNLRE